MRDLHEKKDPLGLCADTSMLNETRPISVRCIGVIRHPRLLDLDKAPPNVRLDYMYLFHISHL